MAKTIVVLDQVRIGADSQQNAHKSSGECWVFLKALH